MKISFTKMHGCGNDFVIVDGRQFPDMKWGNLSSKLLDRRFGIGGDQFLVLLPSQKAHVRMGVFERNGRESEMCGNGIRCVAHLLKEAGEIDSTVSIETLGGLKRVEVESNNQFRVDMGTPTLDTSLWGKGVVINGVKRTLYSLSMGNPHAVVFVDTLEEIEKIQEVGPIIEKDSFFPQRTNVELVFVRDRKNVAARIWERGAGETQACGTGASAVAVAAIHEGKADSPTKVHFRGGTLEIAWKSGGVVEMTGPATHVFTGEVEV